MMRQNKPVEFGKYDMSVFKKAGKFLFCWSHNFVQETDYPYYEAIHNLRFTIVSDPKVSDATSPSAVNVNEHIVHFDL